MTDVYDVRDKACNSVYVVKRGGLWYRWHPGFPPFIGPSSVLMSGEEQDKQNSISEIIRTNRRSTFL